MKRYNTSSHELRNHNGLSYLQFSFRWHVMRFKRFPVNVGTAIEFLYEFLKKGHAAY